MTMQLRLEFSNGDVRQDFSNIPVDCLQQIFYRWLFLLTRSPIYWKSFVAIVKANRLHEVGYEAKYDTTSQALNVKQGGHARVIFCGYDSPDIRPDNVKLKFSPKALQKNF